MSRRRWIQLGIAIALVVVALAVFLDLGAMGHLLAAASLPLFAATIAVAALDQTVMGLKWNLLLKTFGVHVPLRVPVLAYWRGRFLRLVLPSNLGFDAYRAYFIKSHGADLMPVLNSIFVERFFGMLSSLAVIALLFPFALDGLGVGIAAWAWPLAAAGFAAVWGATLLAIRLSHLPGKLSRVPVLPARFQKPVLAFLAALGKVQASRGRVLLYFAFSNLEKLSYGLCAFLAARALGLDVGPLYFIAAIPVIALLERLPISFSSIGVREGLFVALLHPLGFDQNVAVSVGLVVRAAELVLILLSLSSWLPGRRNASLKERMEAARKEMATIETS